jgi:hypothetical protein
VIAHPNRKANPIVAQVRAMIGSRNRITRPEMRGLLCALAERGLVDVVNQWFQPVDETGRKMSHDGPFASVSAQRRAYVDSIEAACRDLTVISVLAETDPLEARYASSNPGTIRYDQPGSMHPLLRASAMFAATSCCARQETVDYLRRRTRRLLIVEG